MEHRIDCDMDEDCSCDVGRKKAIVAGYMQERPAFALALQGTCSLRALRQPIETEEELEATLLDFLLWMEAEAEKL